MKPKILKLYSYLYFEYKINEHDLEMTELDDSKRQFERKEEIKQISFKLVNKKQTKEEYINNVAKFSQRMKESIIYDVFHTPEKFYSKEEVEKADKNSPLFIQGVLATFLQKQGIICAIEKKNSSDSQSTAATLQLIASGEAFKRKLHFCYSHGNEADANIVFDQNQKKKFICDKKKQYSKILKVPEDDIIITDPEYGSINFWVDIKNRNLTENQINDILATEGSRNVNLGCLICACKINPDFFDKKGNRRSGWGINEKRGPPGHLIDYIPPLGWDGYGLKVENQYDNGDNTWLGYTNKVGEWYIAYHGTLGRCGELILENGFRRGSGQVCTNCRNMNPLTNGDRSILGDGVYCTPDISEAETYSRETISFLGRQYKFVFMVRVNPYKVRMGSNQYWVVNGDSLDEQGRKYDEEIRPYRILLKDLSSDNNSNCNIF